MACLTGLVALIPTAPAQTLLLDFGPTTTLVADAAKSPAHAVGTVPLSQTAWNTLSADASTLVFADGTSATGVAVDLGRSSAGVDTINFSDNGFSVGALGGSINTGVYSGTSPVKDGIFGGSGGGNNLAVGLRVNGLAAGVYTIYVHGRNTSASGLTSQRFYATNGAPATSYSFTTSDATVVVTNSTPANTAGFVEGNNFGVLTVTLGAGESLYLAGEGIVTSPTAELRGFLNTVEIYTGVPAFGAKITSQPTGKNVYQGVTVTFQTAVVGIDPITNQWRWNGTNLVAGATIIGATSNVLTLKRVTPDQAGDYSLAVTNVSGADLSSNATLTVVSTLNTAQASNVWNLLPGERTYLGTGATERNLAFNPLTTNLLLVSRQPSESIIVLDPETGAEKHQLDMTGIPTSVPGVSLGLNTIGIAADGAVYAAGLTVSAASPAFYVYRWPNDNAGNPPVAVFAGDPGASVQPNLAWADAMAVRGAGPDTQILISPRTGTNVALLRTSSGLDFLTEIPPAMLAISGVPANFARFSVAWGPGTSTFWAKTTGGLLYLIQFDLNASTGAVVHAYASTTSFPSGVRGISVNANQSLLAGVTLESLGDTLRLYDLTDLEVGPVLRDQETFETQNPNVNGTAATVFGGDRYLFALNTDNGLKAFVINTNYVPPSITIVAQPANRTVMAGATVTFTALAAGDAPMYYQWKFNGTNNLVDGPNVSGANTNVLVLKNVTTNSAGEYRLVVSNAFATATSSNATLTVLPTFNTTQMSNTWNLLAGERTYLGTNNTERGLAFNRATTNLLLVSRAGPDPIVVVLDPASGAEKHFLDVTGIPASVANQSLGLNTIGVAADGAVYGAGVTVSASSPALYLYRWADDSAVSAPVMVFAGDPAGAVQPNLRWTDALAVRGAGTNTEILMSPGSGTNVAILRTSSGLDFQNEIPPAVIAVTGVPDSFARHGLAWGPGTNTFWAKNNGGQLYLIQYDVNAATGAVLHAYATNVVPATLRNISSDADAKFLAGLVTETSATVRLYDITDVNGGPVLRDQEVFATLNPQLTLGGTGATAIGGGYVFALDSNNGLKAFLINPNFVPPVTAFSITSLTPAGNSIVLSWPSVMGQVFQIEARDALPGGTWTALGSSTTATGSTTAFTNTITGDSRFYRVRAN